MLMQAGILVGLGMLVVGVISTIYSIRLLIDMRIKTERTSYEDLTVHYFGRWPS